MRVVVLHPDRKMTHYRGLSAAPSVTELIQIPYDRLRTARSGSLAAQDIITVARRVRRSRADAVVLGLVPFDPRLLALTRALCDVPVAYYTSWCRWSPELSGAKGRVVQQLGLSGHWTSMLDRSVQAIIGVTATAERGCVAAIGDRPHAWVGHAIRAPFFKRPENAHRAGVRCLFVGRLVGSKNPLGAVAAVANLRRLGCEAELTVVGAGPLERALRDRTADLDWCRIVGTVDDVDQLAALYRAHDVLLAPGVRTRRWEELFGIAICEALACGLCVVASDHAGPTELLTGLPGCRLTRSVEPEDLARSVLEALAERSSGIEARVDRAREFTLENVANRWEGILQRLPA